MVIMTRAQTKSGLTDKVFWYKAPDYNIEEKIGNIQYRELHHNYYNKRWQKEQKKYDVDAYLDEKRRTKTRIEVTKIK